MNAYKFLAKGARGPLSGFEWPVPRHGQPAAWVNVEGPLELGVRGVHVCGEADLAHWLHAELWELEAGGERLDGVDCFVVRRARLVRGIDTWTDGGATRFTLACIERARGVLADARGATASGLLDDAESAARHGYLAVSAYCAALAVARLGNSAETETSFRRERAWQSQWIARELLANSSAGAG